MSHVKPNTGDSLNDYFTSLIEFTSLSPHLLQAKNSRNFEIWLEKLELIDRRALFLFLRKHKEEIPEEHLRIAQRRYLKKI